MEYFNEHINRIQKAAGDVGLSESEKARVRTHVYSYMRAHPVRTGFFARFHLWLSEEFLVARLHPIALGLVCAVTISAGSAYAAEGSLPGDRLYPIKLNVTEPLQRFAAWTPQSRAQVALLHTQRRLEEAEALVARGALTDENQKDLTQRITQHAVELESEAEKQDDSQALAVRSDFEAVLSAHADVLDEVALDPEDGTVLQPVLAVVREREYRLRELRAAFARQKETEATGTVLALVERHRAHAEEKMKMSPGTDLAAARSASSGPESDFGRGNEDLREGNLVPALIAFDDAARGAEKMRERKVAESRLRERLAMRDMSRAKHSNEGVSGQESAASMPNPAAATMMMVLPASSTATSTATSTEPLPEEHKKREDR
ncbi:hypothetical protein EBR66_01500 [bacterium]|nr:hypothetical protein [bacterium]